MAPSTAAISDIGPCAIEMTMTNVDLVREYLLDLQARITTACTQVDGAAFIRDKWNKDEGEPLQGDGMTAILEGGQVFERAGCGFSHVAGPRLPTSATQNRPELAGGLAEVRPRRAHRLTIGSSLPAQVGFLDHVLGVHNAAEHPVRYGEEQRAVQIKRASHVCRVRLRPP